MTSPKQNVPATPVTAAPDTTAPNTTAPTADKATLQVVTTFLPMTQFTKAVAGDRAQVTQLLPPGAEPHNYQATPEAASTLATARVLVKNGLGMEAFLDGLIKNAGNPDLRIVDSSRGVATIKTEELEVGGHSHKHDHGHDHGEFNPHIWLDPKRAIQQVENIRDGLIAADPDGKEIYTRNAAGYIQKLRALDLEIAAALKPYRGKTFIAYHDFAPYFAQSYNLNASFLVDVPEDNPAPADVRRVMEMARASNLRTLLTEPQSGRDVFGAIAEDLGVRVSTFNPLETGDTAALEPDAYLATMRQNLKSLKSAFSGPTSSSVLLPRFLEADRRLVSNRLQQP